MTGRRIAAEGAMTALDVLEVGDGVVATDRRDLVAVWDGQQTYRIYRVVDGGWTELERFFDSSGDHTGALMRWMFSG